jgi:hypothetical protein
MAGGMGVRKNVHIENWAAYRENCEHVFKFTRGAWARLAIFGFAVPYAAYRAIIYELVRPLASAQPPDSPPSLARPH